MSRILIIEDDDHVAKIILEALELRGKVGARAGRVGPRIQRTEHRCQLALRRLELALALSSKFGNTICRAHVRIVRNNKRCD